MRKSALYLFGLVVTLIVTLGFVILSSASEASGLRLYHDAYYFMKRQFAYLGVGLVAATVIALIDYRKWREIPALTWLLYAVILALLLAVFLFDPIKGSRRWLPLGIVRLQPSEFAKIALVIVLSVWLDRVGWRVETLKRGLVLPSMIIACIALPVLFEPDFGSVMVIGVVSIVLMLVAGVRIFHLVLLGSVGAVGFGCYLLTNMNRMARLSAFFGKKLTVIGAQVSDAAADKAAYQAQQALAAIGNGGIWGVGLNQSMQKHYYLPEAHTDFIFAIGAEELGLIFSIAVILLFVAFFAFSVYIARNAADRLGRLLVVGMAFILFFEAMFNIGVVCKAFPTKGMALPFFSYGGTNMVSAFIAVGTILSVGIHSYRESKRVFVARDGRKAHARG